MHEYVFAVFCSVYSGVPLGIYDRKMISVRIVIFFVEDDTRVW